MITNNMLYDIMIYVYALSLLFYFSDAADASWRAKRIGTGLLIFVWILQTGYLIYRILLHLHLEVYALFEYLFIFSWLLVTISLVMSRFFRLEYVVFFANVVGFVVLVLNLLTKPGVLIPLGNGELSRTLLYLHIVLISCAYAMFTIAMILSCMYLFLHRGLKRKRWSKTMKRLPSLEIMDRYVFRLVVTGLPLLVLSLAVAVTAIIIDGKITLLLDFKVFSSLFAVVAYFYYMFQRTVLRQSGVRTAIWNIAAFVLLLSNGFANSLSRFHNWLS